MGKPEDYDEAEENAEETTSRSSANTYEEKTSKRLYRDTDDRVLGGVCSGISAYFGVNDPLFLRLIFALSLILLGFGFWLYIILWVIVPKAKTTTEKLRMRGESVNVSNLSLIHI